MQNFEDQQTDTRFLSEDNEHSFFSNSMNTFSMNGVETFNTCSVLYSDDLQIIKIFVRTDWKWHLNNVECNDTHQLKQKLFEPVWEILTFIFSFGIF